MNPGRLWGPSPGLVRSTSTRKKRAGRRSRTTVPRSDWTETTLGCCPEQRDQTGTPSISPTVWTTHTSLRELDRRRVQTGKTRLGLFEPSVSPPTKHAHLLHTKVERWSMGRCSSLNLQLPSEVNWSKKMPEIHHRHIPVPTSLHIQR